MTDSDDIDYDEEVTRTFKFCRGEITAYNKAKPKDMRLCDWVRRTLNEAAGLTSHESHPDPHLR